VEAGEQTGWFDWGHGSPRKAAAAAAAGGTTFGVVVGVSSVEEGQKGRTDGEEEEKREQTCPFPGVPARNSNRLKKLVSSPGLQEAGWEKDPRLETVASVSVRHWRHLVDVKLGCLRMDRVFLGPRRSTIFAFYFPSMCCKPRALTPGGDCNVHVTT
jgi:hypothetical protein